MITARAPQQIGYAAQLDDLAEAVVANASRRYAEAAVAARTAAHCPLRELGTQALAELAEALAHLGHRAELDAVLAELELRSRLSGSTLVHGMSVRAHAVAARRGDAEHLFRRAIELLAATSSESELARAHLTYGEWLRRERRPTDARRHLREAHERFVRMGAESFAARAQAELRAAGERLPQRSSSPVDLTAQERQVALLAGQGQTNKEIATQLYLSASTVDFHLRKVYRKLGISSRRQLAGTQLD